MSTRTGLSPMPSCMIAARRQTRQNIAFRKSNGLKRPPSCEPRALNLFVKEGFAEKFKNAFTERFGGCFRLYTRDEILSSGLFGEGAPRSGLEKVIGDFFAVATGDTSIFNTREKAKKFVGVHAGLTRDELRIPLIALKK